MDIFILNRDEEVVQILSDSAEKSACHFFDSMLTTEVNKGSNFSFSVDVGAEGGLENIIEENMVVVPFEDSYKLFIIKEVIDVHEEGLIKEVFCEDAQIELSDEIVIEEFEGNQECKTVLDKMLKNTRWVSGVVDDFYIRKLTAGYKTRTVLDGITTLVGEYDVEVQYTVELVGTRIVARKVNIKKAFGRTLGKRFEASKDIVSLKRTIQTGDIKTAIIPYGKTNEETGEVVTIAGIEWVTPNNPMNKPIGQVYLEDLEATEKWGYKDKADKRRARWIAVTFEDAETPEELITLAHMQLKRFTEPKVSYEVDAVDLYKLLGEEYVHEEVRIGDLVNIIDHDFSPALTLVSRVVKIEQDISDNPTTKVTLGNIVESIVDKDLKTQIEELNIKIGAVQSNVDLSGVNDRLDDLEWNTSSGRFEDINEINNLLFGESTGFHYMEGELGIWVYDKPKNQKPTKAVAIKGGMIGLASWDSQLQKWNIGTFIDGNSVNASMITTGTLSADRIEAGSIKADRLHIDIQGKLEDSASKTEVNQKFEVMAGEFTSEINKITVSVEEKADKSSTYTKDETDSQIKQKVDSISLEVEAVSDKVEVVDGKIVSVDTRLTSAESKITPDAITNTVKSAQTNGKDTFAQTSKVEQMVDKVKFDFSSSGGTNLLRNSKGQKGNINYWTGEGHPLVVTHIPAVSGNAFRGVSPFVGRYTEWQTLKPNTDYVLQANIYITEKMAIGGFTPVHGWYNKTPTAGQDISLLTVLDHRQVPVPHNWTRCYYHFRTSNTTDPIWFLPVIYTGDSIGNVWFTEVSLSESVTETSWTPHASEIYDGNTVIDATGVTINNGALTIKNKAGAIALQGDADGNLFGVNGRFSVRNDIGEVGFNSSGISFYDSRSGHSSQIELIDGTTNPVMYHRNAGATFTGTQSGNSAFSVLDMPVRCPSGFSLTTGKDTISNAPWYGIGMTDFRLGDSNATQLAGYYGVRVRTMGSILDIPQQGGQGISCNADFRVGSNLVIGNHRNAPRWAFIDLGFTGMTLRRSHTAQTDDWYNQGVFRFDTNVGGSNPGIQFSTDGAWIKGIPHADLVQFRNPPDNNFARVEAAGFNNVSKTELKENIKPLDDSLNFIDVLMKNEIKQYNYKNEMESFNKLEESAKERGYELDIDKVSADTKLGFILEDISEDVKDILNPVGTSGVDLYAMTSALWKICQEQQKLIEQLSGRVDSLEK